SRSSAFVSAVRLCLIPIRIYDTYENRTRQLGTRKQQLRYQSVSQCAANPSRTYGSHRLVVSHCNRCQRLPHLLTAPKRPYRLPGGTRESTSPVRSRRERRLPLPVQPRVCGLPPGHCDLIL